MTGTAIEPPGWTWIHYCSALKENRQSIYNRCLYCHAKAPKIIVAGVTIQWKETILTKGELKEIAKRNRSREDERFDMGKDFGIDQSETERWKVIAECRHRDIALLLRHIEFLQKEKDYTP